MMAIALSLLSAGSLGSGAVAGRAGMQGERPVAVLGIALAVGFIGVTIIDLALDPFGLFEVPLAALPWIAAFGVVQFGVGRTTAYIGLSTIGASGVAPFISTQVPFAAFFAVAFAGETLHPLAGVGTVAVMACLLMAGAATGTATVLAQQTVNIHDSSLSIAALGMFIVIPVVGIIVAAVRPPRSSTGVRWGSSSSRA